MFNSAVNRRRSNLLSGASRLRQIPNGAAVQERPQHISSSDEDDGYDSDLLERRLSEQHGEATEVGNADTVINENLNDDDVNRTKRKKTDEEIAAEYADVKAKKSRRPRPTLEPANLVGSDGLVNIKSGFPTSFSKLKTKAVGRNITKKNRASALAQNAQYASRLIKSYRQFCHDLMPSMAPEDTLMKIQELGSKTQTKEYLKHMRDEVRNDHVLRLYGLEKGEVLLEELDMGLQGEHGHGNGANGWGQAPEDMQEELDGPEDASTVVAAATANDGGIYATENASNVARTAAPSSTNTTETEPLAEPATRTENLAKEAPANDPESDDEFEMLDDTAANAAGADPETQPSSAKPKPSQVTRIIDDSSDEE